MSNNQQGARVQSLKVPGMPCPECSTPIVVDPMLLLTGTPIKCAACHLELTINMEKSKSTIDALKQHMDAFSEIEEGLTEKSQGLVSATNSGKRGKRPPRRRTRREA